MSALTYLQEKEWSMGNGQCPDCYGLGKSFTKRNDDIDIGHKTDCKLAQAIKVLGGEPLYIGSYDSGFEYESYISESGIFGRRVKTENGCLRYKEHAKKINDSLDAAMKPLLEKLIKELGAENEL